VEDVGGQRARRCHLSFERFFLNLNSTKLLDQLTGILPFHLRQEDPDPTKPTSLPRKMYHVGSMFSISLSPVLNSRNIINSSRLRLIDLVFPAVQHPNWSSG
jgi:hypothetical protein